MISLYPPITTASELQNWLHYIADNAPALAETVLGKPLPIDTLCIFAQSDEEYEFVAAALRLLGQESKFTHGPTLYIDVEQAIRGQRIRLLGVRRPDDSRPQRGYADYPVSDYAQLLIETTTSPFTKEITSGRGQSLLELRHPDFDTLGYVFDSVDH